MKSVKKHLEETKPDRVKAFEAGAAAYVKKIVAGFKDYEFVSLIQSRLVSILNDLQYVGESMNPDGMVALLNYRVSFLSFAPLS